MQENSQAFGVVATINGTYMFKYYLNICYILYKINF